MSQHTPGPWEIDTDRRSGAAAISRAFASALTDSATGKYFCDSKPAEAFMCCIIHGPVARYGVQLECSGSMAGWIRGHELKHVMALS